MKRILIFAVILASCGTTDKDYTAGDPSNPESYVVDCYLACGLGYHEELEGLQVKDVDPEDSPVYAVPMIPVHDAGSLKVEDHWYNKVVGYSEIWELIKGLKPEKITVGDTGVHEHKELKGRVEQKNFYTNDFDNGAHGSHCAGIVAATTLGIFNTADILSYKLLRGSGSGSTSKINEALELFRIQKESKTFSGSFGGLFKSTQQRAILLNIYKDKTKFCVFAAGNSTNGDGVESRVLFPARWGEEVDFQNSGHIVVAASDGRFGNVRVASYSSGGEGITITGCGTAIESIVGPNDEDIKLFSGTSMATPTVSAIIGIAQAIFKKHANREFEHKDFWKALENADTHYSIEDGTRRDGKYGQVHYVNFIKEVFRLAGVEKEITPPPVPDPAKDICIDLGYRDWADSGTIGLGRATYSFTTKSNQKTRTRRIENAVLSMVQSWTRQYKYVKPVPRESTLGNVRNIRGIPVRLIEQEINGVCKVQVLTQFEVLEKK